jgi:hypothetical protein
MVAELHGFAERAMRDAIVAARAAGHSWRAIGAHLDIPYQTLHRRYGSITIRSGL